MAEGGLSPPATPPGPGSPTTSTSLLGSPLSPVPILPIDQINPVILAKIRVPINPEPVFIKSVTNGSASFFWEPPCISGFEELTDEELQGIDITLTYTIQQALYNVEDSEFTTVLDMSEENTCMFPNLKMGTVYKYRICCWNIIGQSAWSPEFLIETCDYRNAHIYELQKAVVNNDIVWAMAMLEKWPILAHQLTFQGQSTLALAASRNHVSIVSRLLSLNVDLNYQGCSHCRMSSLLLACRSNSSECAEILIRARANWRLEDHIGLTAIHYAAGNGNAKIVQLLLNVGVPVDFVGVTDHLKRTPLHCAAVNLGNDDPVDLLLCSNANVDRQDMLGNTALMLACAEKTSCYYEFNVNRWIIEALVRYEANPFVRNREGKSALDIARSANKKKIVVILEEYGKQYLLDSLARQFNAKLEFVNNNKIEEKEAAESKLQPEPQSCQPMEFQPTSDSDGMPVPRPFQPQDSQSTSDSDGD